MLHVTCFMLHVIQCSTIYRHRRQDRRTTHGQTTRMVGAWRCGFAHYLGIFRHRNIHNRSDCHCSDFHHVRFLPAIQPTTQQIHYGLFFFYATSQNVCLEKAARQNRSYRQSKKRSHRQIPQSKKSQQSKNRRNFENIGSKIIKIHGKTTF